MQELEQRTERLPKIAVGPMVGTVSPRLFEDLRILDGTGKNSICFSVLLSSLDSP